ncbi:MAG: hypothetical protein H6807_13305 [Planctomycetes bacterium]|nr:hypothetical protein [Planctomycetota bacterium]
MGRDTDHPRFKRNNFTVDRPWQLSVYRNLALVILITVALLIAGLYVVLTRNPASQWSGRQIGIIAVAVVVQFLGVMFLSLWVVAQRVTHSVAGPARLIKTAVDGLLEGDYDRRLALRRHDYLKDLAASVKQLSDQLRGQAALKEEICLELEGALEQGDGERAQVLVRRLRGLSGAAAPAEDPSPVATRT